MKGIRASNEVLRPKDEVSNNWPEHPGATLADVDLNLLVALEALLLYQNVSRAAQHVGMTQPAMSRALARLRQLFCDDLLIRGGSGMKLTVKGAHLCSSLRTVMAQIRNVVAMKHEKSEIRLSIDESLAPIFLPPLLRDSAESQSALRASTFQSASSAMEQLHAGSVDFAVGSFPETMIERVHSSVIASEEFVTLVARERRDMFYRPYAFYDLAHANLVTDGVELYPRVGDALLGAGVKRARLIDFPNVLSAALVSLEGELALTVPRSVARWLVRFLPLAMGATPVAIGRHRTAMIWLGEAFDQETSQAFEQIKETLRALIKTDETAAQTAIHLSAPRIIGNVTHSEPPVFNRDFSGSAATF